MATLGSLIRGDLPPVGNRLSLQRAITDTHVCVNFPGYHSVAVGSGTEALALAMQNIRQRCDSIACPEVILPAYGCPDLVAAAVYAGLQPVLIDIDGDSPGFDLALLVGELNDNTVAVVAVNFLGIPEQLAAIRQLLLPWPRVALIEDNAQCYPELCSEAALECDYVVLSFGRGKPVSLLGGGVLLVRESLVDKGSMDSDILQNPRPSVASGAVTALKMLAYNVLLKPAFYQLLSRNPLLKLGQTVYHPLDSIAAMDSFRLSVLRSNVSRYQSRDRQREGLMRNIVASCSDYALVDLAACSNIPAGRLLRFPLLCADKQHRDQLLSVLVAQGLGATAMYRLRLQDLPGVRRLVQSRGNSDGAQRFADRLLTVPLHEGVTSAHIVRLAAVLNG